MNIPKHSFICWIVMHRRLLTRDRPAKMGIYQDKECLLCGSKPESINHLFFETNIEGLWRRITRRAKGKISRSLIKAVLAALTYHIWQARNGALWNEAVTSPGKILKMIKEESRSRITASNNKDADWINNLFN
ncbi:hypothetical protein R3W88_014001 [Solanum pinnatisectum]|uniref:Reverse transcriptase zinc-binding domain-containing protein n=1 Tax=Solanum pinnatisectum TaxID=50273 RepID=A0AAV9KRS3_9SOLN|nr:hypothetical protein R3W88_014001 [Solanum pinnatisectum]